MRYIKFLCLFSIAIANNTFASVDLEKSFLTPPDSTKPYMYWYWINNNASARGITKDLEAMRAAGIGEVFIGHVVSDGIPEGTVPILSPEWWELVSFAVTEGDRIGVRVGMFNGPGWSQSGGPWMKAEQSMRYLVSKETRVKGGTEFNGIVSKHEKSLQDVAVIAYPVPDQDGVIVRPEKVSISGSGNNDLESIALKGTGAKPAKIGRAPVSIELSFKKPYAFQNLTMNFGDSRVKVEGTVESIDGGKSVKLRDFAIFRTNLGDAMGPLVKDPFNLSFTPTKSSKIRITFNKIDVEPELYDIYPSPAARIDFSAEKQLGRMYPEPVPPVDAFVWPAMPECAEGTAVDLNQTVILTDRMEPDGTLKWKAPEGSDWIIERFNMATTGKMCGPTPPQAQGLECDKMSKEAVAVHFDGMIGKFLRRIPKKQRKGFQHITLDSYEVGPQNWTDGMTDIFIDRFGYNPVPWLDVITGRVVGNREQSDRFLRDWRRLVADLIAENYVGGLKEAANRHGIKTWLENYGHWGFPGESLQYGGASDDIGGEYWLWNTLGDVECRLASSTAHIYGKQVVSAEAFTSNRNFVQTPANIKTRGDWCMTQGINHFVLHLYTHQPYDASPGIVPWFGTDFNRNSTWFKNYGRGWTDYLRRCCLLLQQGSHVADVAYFFGEDTPRMNGIREPALPQGYDYDYINAEVLLTQAKCKKGRIVLPHGQSYRVLVLPPCETMTPELLEQIAKFTRQGLTVLGDPPLRSPSLKNYPACDQRIKDLTDKLWGVNPPARLERETGKGRVFRGYSLEEVFTRLNIPQDMKCTAPDVLWTHRTTDDAEIYFLSNQNEEESIEIKPVFRVSGRIPEFWCAGNGKLSYPAIYKSTEAGIRVPIELAPTESTFVIFRKKDRKPFTVTQLTCNGKQLINCTPEKAPDLLLEKEDSINEFSMTAFICTDEHIRLPKESASGIANQGQNFAIMPTHGNKWGPEHAGAGLSVGKNGVVVLEHWHENMPPVLVWEAPGPLTGWNHIAVIFEEGIPSLYINGIHIKRGLSSGRKVHASPASKAVFSGELIGARNFNEVLTDKRITDLIRNRPDLNKGAPTAMTSNPDGALTLLAPVPGNYTAKLSDGTMKEWLVSSTPRPVLLTTGSWMIEFEQRDDMKCIVEWDTLKDWKDSDNPLIKYFSGTAVYRRTFNWNNDIDGIEVLLDLGKVKNIASVCLNGKEMGIIWHPPYRVDVTRALIKGENTLEIRVANEWFNRFIGDEQLPDDTGADNNGTVQKWPGWVLANKERPHKKRVSFVSKKMVTKDTPLHSSGLLGDVLLLPQQIVN